MRRAHFLRANRSSRRIHAAVWVDTETDEVRERDGSYTHHLRFGWCCYQRRRSSTTWSQPQWVRFDSTAAFWDAVEGWIRPRVKLHVYAHNWAFDAPVLRTFTQLPGRGWCLTTAVIDSPPVLLGWRRGPTSLLMVDTLNWWRMPLQTIGAQVGVPKLSMPAAGASPALWDTYCRRDVEVIRRACHAWWTLIATHDLGTTAATIGGQALAAFRHRFCHHPLLIDQSTEACAMARDSLHGGRCEAFRLGHIRQPVTLCDVTSMYPAVMATERMPTVLRGVWGAVPLDEVRNLVRRRAVVARCRVDTERPVYPVVRDHRLLFPVGAFSATLTTPELVTALAHDELVAIERLAVYDAAVLFDDYVSTIYRLRREALDAGRLVDGWLLKILLNSLYGKFAQRGRRWVVLEQTDDLTVRQWTEWDVDTVTLTYYRQLGGAVYVRRDEAESEQSHPAIAAHVTAYARLRLWDLIQRAGADDVVYCDTDSVLVSDAGAARLAPLVDGAALGGLRVVGRWESATVHGAKDYELASTRVVKGVRASAVWTSAVTVEQDQWDSLVGLVARQSLDAPRRRRQTKRLTRTYAKGIVENDGRVLPFRWPDGGQD